MIRKWIKYLLVMLVVSIPLCELLRDPAWKALPLLAR